MFDVFQEGVVFLEGGFEAGDWDELDFALEAVAIGGREEPVAGFTGGARGNARRRTVFVRA